MAVEIRILSGARKGERIVLEGTEFQAGGDSRCGIFFDPRLDASARNRSVQFRLATDGWRVESTGAGEVLLNQTPVVKESPIRSGDLIRLSEFGPDFSFAVTSYAAAVANSADTVSTTAARTPPAIPASAVAETDTGRGDAACEDAACQDAAAEMPSGPLPGSLGNGWRSSVWSRVAVVAAALAGLILIGVAVSNRADTPEDARAAAPPSDGPDSNRVAPNSGVVPPEAVVSDGETPKPPPERETPDEPDEPEDTWVRVENERKAALYLVQVEVSGPKGNFSWPFCTCFAIDDHTLLTSAREVLQLAASLDKGYRVWAFDPRTKSKTAIRKLRVPRRFVDLANTQGDWIYFNWGLLVTDDKLPKSGPLASPEKLQDLEEGLPVACFGFPHTGDKITSFDRFESKLTPGKIYFINHSPGSAPGARLLELKAKISENMYGSPILNRQAEVVAVYCEAASSENVGVEDLHYAPVLDRELLRSWLEKTDTSRWVEPPVPEIPSSE